MHMHSWRMHMGTQLPKLLSRRCFIGDAVLGCSSLSFKVKSTSTSFAQGLTRFPYRTKASMQQQQQHQEQALHILGRPSNTIRPYKITNSAIY
jgi:hypothetical protein